MRLAKKILAIMLASSNTYASSTLVRGEGSTHLDFQIYHEKHPSNRTFLETQSEELRKNASRFYIKEKFVAAKSQLLKGETEKAKSIFFEIVNKYLDADWSDTEHALICHSFLTLAEIATPLSEKKYWISRALGFAMGEIPELDALSLTTKKIISEILRDSGKMSPFPNELLLNWDMVLINGRIIPRSQKKEVRLWPESYRVTLLSNQFLPQTKNISGNQIEYLNIEPEYIVSGNCQTPQLNSKANMSAKFLVIFSTNCQRDWDKEWLLGKGSTLLMPYDFNPKPSLEVSSPSPPIYKSKLFWATLIGVSAVAILVNQESSDKGSHPPTSTALDDDY